MATLLARCPHCNARGLDYLVIEQVKQLTLVYCGACGAIHGVLPALTEAIPAPTAAQSIPAQPEPVPAPAKNGQTPTPPVCRQHHLVMERKTVPPGHPDTGQQIWMCPRFKECHQWERIEETAHLTK